MYVVNGFSFENESEAERAKKEVESIRIIREQTKLDNPEIVLKLYNALLQKRYFKTQVGIAFLVELREYLCASAIVKKEDLWPIPILEKKAEPEKKVIEKVVKEPDAYKTPFRISMFFSVVFVMIILGMFTISYYSKDNVNIINYENALIDKYEKWEAELIEREKQLENK
ncbi:MAG: hypothetical protein U0K68_05925 [Agathobacter sp.]|nr:hypothetical protein [Agathobacter sp.]